MIISFADTSDLLSWNLEVYIFGNHLITKSLNYNLKTYREINDIPNKLRNDSLWHAAIFDKMKNVLHILNESRQIGM